ncbi:MAG TPA: hypothetical protein DHW64_12745 [Chitinophagaceae bacterium]|nr:hypothetical protein [Chitinophagaceae bacterium]
MKWIIVFVLMEVSLTTGAQLSTHSRGAGMGDAGIAAAVGNQQLAYNMGKTVFTHHFHQVSVSYLPWMRNLFQDTKFIRADYLTTVGGSATLGVAVNYLDLGNLTTRDDNGASLAIYRNTSFNVGGSVGVRLSENTGIGATLKLISARSFVSGPATRYGISGDIHFYQSFDKISFGAVVNNFGNDIWQTGEIGLGFAYSDRDEVKEWSIGFDLRKTFRENLSKMRYSVGAELGFHESFFIRSGLQLEPVVMGNRKHISIGAGYKGFVEDQSWAIDLHYIIPFGNKAAFAPMQHAYGITLNLHLGNFQ